MGESQGHYDPESAIDFRTIHVVWEPYVLCSPICFMWYSYGRGRTLFVGSIGQMSRSQWEGVYNCFPNFKYKYKKYRIDFECHDIAEILLKLALNTSQSIN